MAEYDNIDLEIALRKIHEWSLTDGDLGHEYWYRVRKLLERAAGMQLEIDALNKKLELCHAKRDLQR